MSSLNVEETVPVVKLWPYDVMLGELLGGIKVLEGASYEFIPIHDKWENRVVPSSYGLALMENKRDINLQVPWGKSANGYFESHVICLEKHGNMGAALMKMNNIACVAIESRDKPPTGQIKKYPNQDIVIPFWMVEVRGAVSEVVRSICVVFPDDYGSGSFYEMVCRLRSQRDHAFDSSIRAAHVSQPRIFRML